MRYIYTIGIILLFSYCKPKEITVEKFITKIDSTEVIKLQEKVNIQTNLIENLENKLEKTRTELTNLQSNTSKHDIKYDTSAKINPYTGEYPKAFESISLNSQIYNNKYIDIENIKQKHNKELDIKRNEIIDLEVEIGLLKDENTELRTSKKPQLKFNIRLAIFSFIFGFIIPILYTSRSKIKKIFFLPKS